MRSTETHSGVRVFIRTLKVQTIQLLPFRVSMTSGDLGDLRLMRCGDIGLGEQEESVEQIDVRTTQAAAAATTITHIDIPSKLLI